MLVGAAIFDGINPLGVLVAALATMVVGFVWYSPLLFARPWMRLMGYDPDDRAKLAEMQKGAGKLYGLSFVASLVSAVVLAKVIDISSVNSVYYESPNTAHEWQTWRRSLHEFAPLLFKEQ